MSKVITKKEIKEMAHPARKIIFGLSAFVTLSLLFIAIMISLNQKSIFVELSNIFINEQSSKIIKNVPNESVSREKAIAELPDYELEILGLVALMFFPIVIIIPLVIFLIGLYRNFKEKGRLLGNAVKLDKKQYPKVYDLYAKIARKLGFKKIPELFIYPSSNLPDSYSGCIPGYRNVVVINSEILATCLQNKDNKTLSFILGHELGHHVLKHTAPLYSFLTFITRNVPVIKLIFGKSLNRAQEYEADKIACYAAGKESRKALALLSAGTDYYWLMDHESYEKEHVNSKVFWSAIHNFFSDFPITSWRISALSQNKHGEIFIPRRNK